MSFGFVYKSEKCKDKKGEEKRKKPWIKSMVFIKTIIIPKGCPIGVQLKTFVQCRLNHHQW